MTDTELKPKIVYDLFEARTWFIENPSIPVKCVRRTDCQERTCDSYRDAQSFFPNPYPHGVEP